VQAGWASLGGLRADDLVERAGDAAVSNLADFKAAREAANAAGKDWWVLLVRRGGQTLFVEINLKQAKAKS
jgi:hypothetical protein